MRAFCSVHWRIVVGALAAPAEAQEWPAKQVNFIVPFSAGGTTDLFGRLLSQHMQKNFDKPFIVENKRRRRRQHRRRRSREGRARRLHLPGRHGVDARDQPVPLFQAALRHREGFPAGQPDCAAAEHPRGAPEPAGEQRAELIAHLKANPDKLSYGSSGAGTSIHLAAELFKIKTGTTMTHVPFRSSGDIMNNLTGGHINLAFDNITLAWPQVKAGRLRALAVSSTARSAIAPDVPTVAETIPGFDATSWHGVFAPAGTPKPIVDKMAAEMKRILELPDVKEKLFEIGAIAAPMTPEDFAKFIDGERAKWADVVKASGAKLD